MNLLLPLVILLSLQGMFTTFAQQENVSKHSISLEKSIHNANNTNTSVIESRASKAERKIYLKALNPEKLSSNRSNETQMNETRALRKPSSNFSSAKLFNAKDAQATEQTSNPSTDRLNKSESDFKKENPSFEHYEYPKHEHQLTNDSKLLNKSHYHEINLDDFFPSLIEISNKNIEQAKNMKKDEKVSQMKNKSEPKSNESIQLEFLSNLKRSKKLDPVRTPAMLSSEVKKINSVNSDNHKNSENPNPKNIDSASSTSSPVTTSYARVFSKLEEKLYALDCEMENLSRDSTVWRGNQTHNLNLPVIFACLGKKILYSKTYHSNFRISRLIAKADRIVRPLSSHGKDQLISNLAMFLLLKSMIDFFFPSKFQAPRGMKGTKHLPANISINFKFSHFQRQFPP